jgi:hypothetical protein
LNVGPEDSLRRPILAGLWTRVGGLEAGTKSAPVCLCACKICNLEELLAAAKKVAQLHFVGEEELEIEGEEKRRERRRI